MIYKSFYNSPVGLIEIGGTENSITSLYFIDEEFNPEAKSNPYIDKCVEQIDEYFNGERKIFKLDIKAEGTEFQKRVWNELLNIPYGETRSYMEITKTLGDKKAIRAVANANGQNKISIIIPCHRVIGSDGSLTGYGGGLWRKKWLLEHEQKFSNTEKQLALNI